MAEDETPAPALPVAPEPTPETQYDFGKVAGNLNEAGACLQQLAAKATKNKQPEKAQDLKDRADIFLDTAEFLRTLVGLVE